VVPVGTALGQPVADPLLSPDVPAPDYLARISIG
jgi:hypothetical protein